MPTATHDVVCHLSTCLVKLPPNYLAVERGWHVCLSDRGPRTPRSQAFVNKDVVTGKLKESDQGTQVSLQDLIRTAEFLEIEDMLELCVVKVRCESVSVQAVPPQRMGFRRSFFNRP